jgi:hypothetical protein
MLTISEQVLDTLANRKLVTCLPTWPTHKVCNNP